MPPNKKRLILVYAIGVFLFCADILLRYLAVTQWNEIRAIKNLFGWYPAANSGIAFGLAVPTNIILLLSVIFLGLMIWFFRLRESRDNVIAAGLVFMFAGALLNFFDRLFSGSVHDYFLLLTSNFNIADVFIVFGAIVIILKSFRRMPK
jgi:lipoprotein signal peptidase